MPPSPQGWRKSVEMDVFEIDVVDLGFRRTQRKKDFAGNLLHAIAERRGSDDL